MIQLRPRAASLALAPTLATRRPYTVLAVSARAALLVPVGPAPRPGSDLWAEGAEFRTAGPQFDGGSDLWAVGAEFRTAGPQFDGGSDLWAVGTEFRTAGPQFAPGMVVVEGVLGARLPNAVLIGDDERGRLRPGGRACLGGPPGRWWDPRPVLGALRPERVAQARRRCPPLGTGPGEAELGTRAAQGDPAALVGLGPGSTPAGDDLLAASLATLRVLGRHAEADRIRAAVDGRRTTALAAALYGHADRGEVAAPVGALLRALAGHGAVAPAVTAVLALGHTSGAWILRGVLAAVAPPVAVGA